MKKYTESEIKESLNNLPNWSYQNGFLIREHSFQNFKEAFAAMTRISFECESLNHHPNWTNVYNRLTIQLQTHDADGITEKDFNLAAAIETIINNPMGSM